MFRCACLVCLAQANRARHSRQELGQSVPALEANSALRRLRLSGNSSVVARSFLAAAVLGRLILKGRNWPPKARYGLKY